MAEISHRPLVDHSPAGVADGQEHAQVTVGYNSQRNEENKAAQHQSITLIGRSGGDVIPRARRHQALRNIRALRKRNNKQTNEVIESTAQ